MKEKILEICTECLPLIDFESSDKLWTDQILDSLSLITLVTELSAEFDVRFDLEILTAENFDSIDAIVQTVKDLQK